MTQKNNIKDVYTIVTDRIIEALESGVAPWRQPWNAYGLPKNYTSRKAYQGFNAFLLNLICTIRKYELPYFITMRQANELGGKIKSGSKSIPVIYWNVCYYDAANKIIPAAAIESTPIASKKAFLKYYSVFNVQDVEGIQLEIPSLNTITAADKIASCEHVLQLVPNPPRLEHANDGQAWYSRALDTVHMPKFETFNKAEFYYSVLFHELAHATGHASRLNRDEIVTPHRFGTPEYSKEELVAEFTAAMVCGVCGIENATIENNAAYLKGWLSVLKDDRKMLIDAASKAQKAADYILDRLPRIEPVAKEPEAITEDLPF